MKTGADSPLKTARLRLGLTQTQAAALCFVAQSTYAGIESGRQRASLDLLHEYAVGLAVDPHELDPRLASSAPGRVLVLLPAGDAPHALVGDSEADRALLRELLPNPSAARPGVERLLRAAASAKVRVVVRTDLPPRLD